MRFHFHIIFAALLFLSSPAAALVSDDFSASTPKSAWTFVNPAGDSSFRITGAGTSSARLEIAVPSGREHEAWTAGNLTPRLMQKCADTDFTVEAKFESPVRSRYQMQGIVVEADAARFLRFEFMSDGSATRAFAASVLGTSGVVRGNKVITAGSALYMQVRRTGNRWEQAWSPDGFNWTVSAAFDLPLAVTAAGVYAGNAGTAPPAHTALVDYFFNAASPIVPEDGAPTETVQGCSVRLWYGSHHVFGNPGIAQRWVNILGDVAGCNDLKSLAFRLNDGAPRPLSLGPDGRRLAGRGDFNVEIPRTDLRPGLNRVEIVATRTSGAQESETVSVDYVTGRTWPLPHHLSWSSAGSLPQAVQIVDGRWTVDGAGVRPTALAYDRTVAIGDISWSDYEVLVPVTLLGVDPGGYNAVSGSPGIGLILRWTGHFDWGGRQPTIGWKPVGATAWYKWDDKLKLRINDRPAGEDLSGRKLAVGKTYLFRMRVETRSNGTPAYAVKVWPQGETEPAAWILSGTGLTSDPARGSLLLVAHHVDVRFGNITITPLSASTPDTTPPQISAISATPAATRATVTWTTDEPARGTVEYGTTTAYGSRVESTTLATSHSHSLTGLAPGTTYNYRVRATDSAGNASTSANRTFTTAANPPPAAAAPRSDNFDGTAINGGIWSFVNPSGDARLTVSGGKASIAIPAGTEHDLWTGGNFTARLVQGIGNGNFEVEAKFDSAVLNRYQMQGIVVEGGAGEFLRCELQGDGTGTRLFVAAVLGSGASVKANRVIAGGAPLYLRVKRAGDSWTVSYSANGSTWTTGASFTQVLGVRAAGVYGGNAGAPAPAHTAVVDYFRNTAAP